MTRGHLLNADGRQANYDIFCPLPGLRGQFASCEYPPNISFYSCNADCIDLAQNSPCDIAEMAEAELEAMYIQVTSANSVHSTRVNADNLECHKIRESFATSTPQWGAADRN